jgi:hypothetical protein
MQQSDDCYSYSYQNVQTARDCNSIAYGYPYSCPIINCQSYTNAYKYISSLPHSDC